MRAECLWHTWNDLVKGCRAKNNRPANLKANKTSTAHLGSWKLPALQERKDLILPKITTCFSLKRSKAEAGRSAKCKERSHLQSRCQIPHLWPLTVHTVHTVHTCFMFDLLNKIALNLSGNSHALGVGYACRNTAKIKQRQWKHLEVSQIS